MKEAHEKKWILLCGAVPLLLLASGLGWNWYKTVPPLKIHDAPLPSPNAYDTFKTAALSLKMPPHPIEVDPILGWEEPPQDPAEFRRRYPPARREFWLQLNKNSFADFERGLGPPYRKYNRHEWPGTPLPNFGGLRRALQVKIHAQREQGDWSGAAQSALNLMQFGLMIPRGGGVTPNAVGKSIESSGRRELWELLPSLDALTTAKSARRLENLLRQRVSLADSLREEKTNYLVCGDQEAFAAMAGGGPNDWKFTLVFRLISPRIILNNYSREMDKTIASTQKPYGEIFNENSNDSFPQTLSDPLTGRIYPVFTRARSIDFQHRTESNLLCAALALRAFRLQNGRYPQNLKELTPRYLRRVPDDPYFPRHPLSYKIRPIKWASRTVVVWRNPQNPPKPDQPLPFNATKEIACEMVLPYTLYSVGNDGRDNGGKPIEITPLNRRDGYWKHDPGVIYKGDFVVGPHITQHIIDRSRVKDFPFAYAANNAPPISKPTPSMSEAAIRAALSAAPPYSALPPEKWID
jgi:hypothetical protein